jgi:hypothetical protein
MGFIGGFQFSRHPAKAGLRRQDAGANTDEVDGPEGEPQDAASNPVTLIEAQRRWVPDHRFAVSGMTSKEMPRFRKRARRSGSPLRGVRNDEQRNAPISEKGLDVPDHRFAVSGMTSEKMPRFRKRAR